MRFTVGGRCAARRARCARRHAAGREHGGAARRRPRSGHCRERQTTIRRRRPSRSRCPRPFAARSRRTRTSIFSSFTPRPGSRSCFTSAAPGCRTGFTICRTTPTRSSRCAPPPAATLAASDNTILRRSGSGPPLRAGGRVPAGNPRRAVSRAISTGNTASRSAAGRSWRRCFRWPSRRAAGNAAAGRVNCARRRHGQLRRADRVAAGHALARAAARPSRPSNPVPLIVTDLPLVREADAANDSAGCGPGSSVSRRHQWPHRARRRCRLLRLRGQERGSAFASKSSPAALQSALDSHLRILDEKGKQLALNDDLKLGKRSHCRFVDRELDRAGRRQVRRRSSRCAPARRAAVSRIS